MKYHLGYRTVRKLGSGAEIEIRLSANPSHLEAVDPVVEGTARARQRIRNDTEASPESSASPYSRRRRLCGQGIVAETLNMSQLPGYSTGGTVHVVVNNQIGFTTLPEDGALVDVRYRRREDDRSANFPCERRRSACREVCDRDGARFSSGIWTRRRDRHVLLPQTWPPGS